ncbi:MAG: hypothetical protein ACE15B_17730 [Bryobacteraceae bacterium]
MDSETAPKPSAGFYGALAGFHAGVLGVLVLLAFAGLASAWYRRGFWGPENVIASVFYGDDAVRAGFTFATLSGLALYVIGYGLLGAAYGRLAYRSSNHLRVFLVAILAALGWYYLWWGWLWEHVDPLVPLYTHDRPMFVGHVLYGMMLGRFPRYYERLTQPPNPPAGRP